MTYIAVHMVSAHVRAAAAQGERGSPCPDSPATAVQLKTLLCCHPHPSLVQMVMPHQCCHQLTWYDAALMVCVCVRAYVCVCVCVQLCLCVYVCARFCVIATAWSEATTVI